MPHLPPIPPTFAAKKSSILASLELPSSDYTDLSPKGSVDEAIIPLIRRINQLDGVVTTSSCAGRVSVFLEGSKKRAQTEERGTEDTLQGRVSEQSAVPGGKGIGGRWLFVSHEPVEVNCIRQKYGSLSKSYGLCRDNATITDESFKSKGMRFARFQFEPMILHIMTASLAHAAAILAAAINAGFRESGVQSLKNLEDPLNTFPMVAVRTSGLAFEALIGYVMADAEGGYKAEEVHSLVGEEYLRLILDIANERFQANTDRRQRFESELFRREQTKRTEWEDAPSRQARKRADGLARQEALKKYPTDQNVNNTVSEDSLGDAAGGTGTDFLGLVSPPS